MDQKLKERVFGALVVVAIAVIFVPMVLDKKQDEAVNISEAIPTPPVEEVAFVEPPQPVAALEANLSAENVTAAVAVLPRGVAPIAATPIAIAPIAVTGPTAKAIEIEPMPAADNEFMALNDETAMVPVVAQMAPAAEPAPVAVAKPVPAIATATAPATAPATALDTAGWAVQMGTFADRNNAKVLEGKLKAKGYSAFLYEVAGANQRLTRVLVGPQTKREDAAKLVSQLEAKVNVKGVVIRYEPLA